MIYFNDWKLTSTCDFLAMQYDNLTRKLSVHGDLARCSALRFTRSASSFALLSRLPDCAAIAAQIIPTAPVIMVQITSVGIIKYPQ
jgi:hypothetical protein